MAALSIPSRFISLSSSLEVLLALGRARCGSLISKTEVSTGSLGLVTVRYTAPNPSGPVAIVGTSNGARDALDTIRVMVPDLVPLPPGPTYELVGDPGQHEGQYHGTQAFVAGLQALANKFFAETSSRLGFNDMSLKLGGVYDLHNNWLGIADVHPHAEHRAGTNVDLRTRDRDPTELDRIRQIWGLISTLPDDKAVRDETKKKDGTPNTRGPHYHLRY